jgi:ELWxxDGT repeat protein
VTNGTAAGTYEIAGIIGAFAGGIFGPGFAPDFTSFNGEVVFSGLNSAGNIGLWVANGTPPFTHELTGISGASAGGLFHGYFPAFTVLNGKVLFIGTDTAGNMGLWVTDGTGAGTHEVTINNAFAQGVFFSLNADLVVFNNKVLFAGWDAGYQTSLWVTDGTTAGTYELTGIKGVWAGGGGLFEGAPVVRPPDLTVFNGKVLFNSLDTAQLSGLWVTDGTAAGTHELTGISGAYTGGPTGAAPGGLDPTSLTVFKSEVLFNGVNANGEHGLWVTDGTAAGTHELTGIKGASWGGQGGSPLLGAVLNEKVLFSGKNSAGLKGLWVTDGTVAGTHELTGIKGASTSGEGLEP